MSYIQRIESEDQLRTDMADLRAPKASPERQEAERRILDLFTRMVDAEKQTQEAYNVLSKAYRIAEMEQKQARTAERERDEARRSLAFAECRREPREFVETKKAKAWAESCWGIEAAKRLFPGVE